MTRLHHGYIFFVKFFAEIPKLGGLGGTHLVHGENGRFEIEAIFSEDVCLLPFVQWPASLLEGLQPLFAQLYIKQVLLNHLLAIV
jgi:hypothetical protein